MEGGLSDIPSVAGWMSHDAWRNSPSIWTPEMLKSVPTSAERFRMLLRMLGASRSNPSA